MKFVTWIIALTLIVGLFTTNRSVRRSKSDAERFFAMRLAIFTWLAGFACVLALIFLPNKQRVLMAIPILVGALTLAKFWRTGRERVRREEEARVSFERIKRVN